VSAAGAGWLARLRWAALVVAAIWAAAALSPAAQASSDVRPFDVEHYGVTLEIDLERRAVHGVEHVRFVAAAGARVTLALDAGALEIDAVREAGLERAFAKRGAQLFVELPAADERDRSVEIRYHGSPPRGVKFLPQSAQVSTAFATSQWLPCVDAPDERATFELTLIAPRGSEVAASGRLLGREDTPAGSVTRWSLEKPAPSYLYGFALGHFVAVDDTSDRVALRYLAPRSFAAKDLDRIFADTHDMLEFFESKAGVSYPHAAYTQVLLEQGSGQEMAGMSVMGVKYGTGVLADPTNVWLGAHELAHEWWGNGVTNASWRHFWLNEGIATFMTAAYLEHRFGRDAYSQQIDAARAKYEALAAAGKDHALVFDDWSSPSADARSIVYDKGAYVLHRLREEIGDDPFWTGLRRYTMSNWGRSVTTPDFQAAMEQAAGRDLGAFFARWVYSVPAGAQ
jgi:aminopeptidase N